MNKIPTAEEYLQELRNSCLVNFVRASDRQKVENGLVEFAKLHVEAALKAASEKAQCKDTKEDPYNEIMVVDKKSISYDNNTNNSIIYSWSIGYLHYTSKTYL